MIKDRQERSLANLVERNGWKELRSRMTSENHWPLEWGLREETNFITYLSFLKVNRTFFLIISHLFELQNK